jgi:hypothetical protein
MWGRKWRTKAGKKIAAKLRHPVVSCQREPAVRLLKFSHPAGAYRRRFDRWSVFFAALDCQLVTAIGMKQCGIQIQRPAELPLSAQFPIAAVS